VAPPVEDGQEAYEGSLVGARIALIDDDRLVRTMVGKFLQRRGCRVRSFGLPDEALAVIAHDHPDAALVDMQMPGMSGMTLVRELHAQLQGLPFPVLFLTSVEEEGAFQEAFRLGVSDYLVKPTTEGELAAKLEKALNDHTAKQPPPLPNRLGGWELLEELQRTTHACVFRTEDSRHRPKSLKVIRPGLVGKAEPLLRLHREIDVLAAANHPGILSLNASGLEGDYLFYVTDEVPRRTLGEELRQKGALDPRGIARLLRWVGLALEHLHNLGVLVGDLGHETLGRLEDGRIVLSDLTSARWLGGVERGDDPSLRVGRTLAPEVLQDGLAVDYTADLYSLGVVALEACSGGPVKRERGTGRIDPSRASSLLSPLLVDVLSRLTEPDAGARIPSASQLVDELDQLPPALR
jgi:DNA-binding response OmpR family regulator